VPLARYIHIHEVLKYTYTIKQTRLLEEQVLYKSVEPTLNSYFLLQTFKHSLTVQHFTEKLLKARRLYDTETRL